MNELIIFTSIFHISWGCSHSIPLRFFHVLYHSLRILLVTVMVGILASDIYICGSLKSIEMKIKMNDI